MKRSAVVYALALFALLCAGQRAFGQGYLPLPDYPSDPDVDTSGRQVAGYAVMPWVWHTGLTYNIDSISGTGITANLGQNVITIVGSDRDSIGQGFWYQLSLRRHNLGPGYGDSLYQNYPNPFNPLTYVPFSISSTLHQHRAVKVKITLTSVLGVNVTTIVDGDYSYGSYAVLFDARALSSGVYIYKMTVDDYGTKIPSHSEFSRKMTFLR